MSMMAKMEICNKMLLKHFLSDVRDENSAIACF